MEFPCYSVVQEEVLRKPVLSFPFGRNGRIDTDEWSNWFSPVQPTRRSNKVKLKVQSYTYIKLIEEKTIGKSNKGDF